MIFTQISIPDSIIFSIYGVGVLIVLALCAHLQLDDEKDILYNWVLNVMLSIAWPLVAAVVLVILISVGFAYLFGLCGAVIGHSACFLIKLFFRFCRFVCNKIRSRKLNTTMLNKETPL